MITIDKNIPIPKKVKNKVYPFSEMEVGDSFLSEVNENDNKHKKNQNVYMAIWKFCQNNKDKKFTSAFEDKGLRVWRIQ